MKDQECTLLLKSNGCNINITFTLFYVLTSTVHSHPLCKVELFICMLTQIFNQMITWKQFSAFRNVEHMLKFKLSIKS